MGDVSIATRRSKLAMTQASQVADLLMAAHPGLEVSLVEVTTSGDRDRTSAVTSLTEVGAFVRAVQQAVLDGRADLAVHSCKDLPVEGPDGLVAFFPPRESPWDVLCGADLDSLREGATVGTGSPRRTAQLRRLRPDLQVRDIRGNVDTRLEKVRRGEYDAVILAEAGLRRLGREEEISYRFSLDEMVPAPAQAVLAVEAPAESPAAALARAVDDPSTRKAVEAERGVLALSQTGCRSALGVFGRAGESGIRLVGFVEDEGGPRRGEVQGADPAEAAQRLREVLAL